MFRYEIDESNSAPTSIISRIFPAPDGATIRVTGFALAGKSDATMGAGSALRGIYGTLMLNADGTLSYALDNLDRDTQRLTSASIGVERFTITFIRDNLVMTGQVEISIKGADEPGQTAVSGPALLQAGGGHGADALFHSGGWAAQQDASVVAGSTVLLDGTYVSRVTGANQALGFNLDVRGTAIVEGRIEMFGPATAGVGVVLDSTIVNNGVISAQASGSTNGVPVGPSAAVGFNHRSSFINNGLVETISPGIGFGVWILGVGTTLVNNGFIFVRGGTVDDPYGVIGIRADAGLDSVIVNTGTIAVDSSNPARDTVGIQFFAGNTNIHVYTDVVNSGTIVADYAFRSIGQYTMSVHITNSGNIEGDVDLVGAGNHVIDNRLGGMWRGTIATGQTQDVVRNAGQILGSVNTLAGADFYDGRGGYVAGTVTVASGISYGGDRDDRLIGGDVIVGGGGQDVLTGNAVSNRFVFMAASDSLETAPDTIVGFVSGQDRIDLSALSITGITLEASGNHTNVRVQTADGPMWIIVGNSSVAMSDILLERAGQRIDGGNDADIVWGAARDATLTGGGGDDMIVGTDGADRIDGGTGFDVAWGGRGDDIYVIDDDNDKTIEFEGEGTDLAQIWVPTLLQAHIENGTLMGNDHIGVSGNVSDNILTGNAGRNQLYGRNGDDVLIGGGSADLLEGGLGRDRFVYLDVTDSTFIARDQIENFERGTDTIDIAALDAVRFTFDLFHNYWTVTFTTVYIETAKGDTLVLRISGTAGFDDFLVRNSQTGSDSADILTTGATTRGALSGAAGDDHLTGSDGADFLDGGLGNDRLTGGAGNDQYFVDALGDLVFEGAGGGIDVVIANASHYLHANVEHLELAQGAFDWFGVGNALDNDIIGNSGANLLIGGAGHDFIFGGEADDILYGEDGDDIMLGGGGTDYLFGGAGDDVLGDGEQGLERFGRADALYGEDGNDYLDGGIGFYTDILVGGDGDDLLDAASGEGDYDLIDGGAGNDVYLVDTGDDLTFEAADGGIDTVRADVRVPGAGVYLYANVENLLLEGTTSFGVGNGLANIVTGNAIGNYLLGGAGDDRLDGRGGNDVLFGEGGADRFVFGVGGGGDVIGDFTRGSDLIDISAFGLASFAELQSRFVQDGTVGAILLGNGDLIVLHNVQMAQLTAADFLI